MNQGKYVFSQFIELLSTTSFRTCVNRYNGNYKVSTFTCWQQFLHMLFGQLTHRESLRDTMLCLALNADKLYHLGIGKVVSLSTLSRANENRDWRIYADYAKVLIEQAKRLYINDHGEIELKQQVFAIDATTIDLCLSVFSWAKFRSTKGAVKIHAQLDLKTAIPEFIEITTGVVNELNVLDLITYQPDSFYVFDRGYIDFKRLFHIHKSNAFFIIRSRDRLRFRRIKSSPVDKHSGLICDQTIMLTTYHPASFYPQPLRRVKYYDSQNDLTLVFLTNNFSLKALEIATLYKHRWKIELFFKWIKQHLKIKSFWGTTENAVKTQIWIAISSYVIVAIAKKTLSIHHSLYEILQVVSISIFDKMPLNKLFDKHSHYAEPDNDSPNQLSIFE
jgi:hypothetical protein